jgi:peptidoglycan/xylan/chitin deacetylase (PgdA/CDA1 family)
MTLGSSLRELAQGLRARRPIHRGIRVLAYHGVVEAIRDRRVERSFHLLSDFREHVAVLRRCHVASIEELLAEPKSTLRPTVVITFDDGFRNNLLAAEILCAHKLPFTIFPSTNNVQTGRPIWPTLLRLILARGSARRVRVAETDYDLEAEETAFARARDAFKRLDIATREQTWQELITRLAPGELDELVADFPSISMLSWDDLRSLLPYGVSVGSHGYQHELHHARQPAEIRHREIVLSKQQIETSLGTPCRSFAFPNGFYTDSSTTELETAGYELGFSTVSRATTRTDQRLLLPRIMPGQAAEKIATAVFFGN